MTKRDELIALADGLSFAAQNTEGCLYSQRKMLNDASAALRRLALEAPAAGDGEPVAWIDPKEFERLYSARGKRPLVGGLFRLHPTQEFDDDVAIYTAQPADAGMREALEDCQTHHDAWRSAITAMFAQGDPDELYWQHELNAFDRTFKALTAPGAPTKSDGGVEGHADLNNGRSSRASQVGRELEEAGFESGPSEPSSTRSEVTALTKRLDQVLKVMRGARNRSEPMAIWADDIKAVEDARALLDQFEFRRK